MIVQRAGKRLKLFTAYRSLPTVRDREWRIATPDELREIESSCSDYQASGNGSGGQSWSDSANDCDLNGSRWATERLSRGDVVYITEDEDGFYFAVEAARKGSQARLSNGRIDRR